MHAWSRSVAQTHSSAGGLVVTLRRCRRRRGRLRAEPADGGDVICGLSDGDRSSTKSTTGSSSFSCGPLYQQGISCICLDRFIQVINSRERGFGGSGWTGFSRVVVEQQERRGAVTSL